MFHNRRLWFGANWNSRASCQEIGQPIPVIWYATSCTFLGVGMASTHCRTSTHSASPRAAGRSSNRKATHPPSATITRRPCMVRVCTCMGDTMARRGWMICTTWRRRVGMLCGWRLKCRVSVPLRGHVTHWIVWGASCTYLEGTMGRNVSTRLRCSTWTRIYGTNLK